MLLPFPKAGILALMTAIALLLMLAVACAPAATPTPVPTATPAPTATVVPTPDTGNWIPGGFTDAIDDTTVVGTALVASESRLEFPYDNPGIGVICHRPSFDEPIVVILVNWREYLGSDEFLEVDWRVNSEAASTKSWVSSGSNLAGPVGPAIEQAIRDLLRAEKITVRVRRDFAENLTAVWHPAGFAAAYKPVAAACGK